MQLLLNQLIQRLIIDTLEMKYLVNLFSLLLLTLVELEKIEIIPDLSAAFIASLAGEKKTINILPYHNIAAKKYEKLGDEYHENGMDMPSEDRQRQIIEKFNNYGLEAAVGG